MGQLLSLLCFSFVILGLVLVCMSCILLSYSLLARLIVHQLIRFLSSVYFSSFMFLPLCFGFPFFQPVQLTSVFLHSILLSMVSATMHPNHSSSSPFHFSWLLIIFTVQLYRHKVHIQCHLLESFVVGVAVTL